MSAAQLPGPRGQPPSPQHHLAPHRQGQGQQPADHRNREAAEDDRPYPRAPCRRGHPLDHLRAEWRQTESKRVTARASTIRPYSGGRTAVEPHLALTLVRGEVALPWRSAVQAAGNQTPWRRGRHPHDEGVGQHDERDGRNCQARVRAHEASSCKNACQATTNSADVVPRTVWKAASVAAAGSALAAATAR